MARTTVLDKIGQWKTAFDMISPEITPQAYRDVLVTMKGVADPGTLNAAERLARMISANDRAAALVAAMLVSSGIRPMPGLDAGLDEDEGS